MSGWIGVDLDGTLAEYHGWGDGSIGKPIPAMVDRVKKWLAEGQEVRIFTARISTNPSSQKDIQDWAIEHVGVALLVTCQKDYQMIELWDDRCHPVELNTGRDLLEEDPAPLSTDIEAQVIAGVEVELEHEKTYRWMLDSIEKGVTPSLHLFAGHIVKDHLNERADYYTQLAKAKL